MENFYKNMEPIDLILALLKILDVKTIQEYSFKGKPYEKYQYDIAVMKPDGNVAFLIEYDGSQHYDPKFFENLGFHKRRARTEVTRYCVIDAKKDKIAFEEGVPLLRLVSLHLSYLYEKLAAYVGLYVHEIDDTNDEILMLKIFDKLGWRIEHSYYEPKEIKPDLLNFLKTRKKSFKKAGEKTRDLEYEFSKRGGKKT